MARRRSSSGSAGGGVLLLVAAAFVGVASLFSSGSPQKAPSAPLPVAAPTYVSLPASPGAVAPLQRPPVDRVERAAPSQAPVVRAQPHTAETLYVSGRKVPLRAAADPKAQILDRFGQGQALTVLERQPEWIRVRHELTQREGWVQAKRLRDAPPPDEAEKPQAPTIAPMLTAAAIAKLLIAESIASYPRSCARPYNTDRGGRSCGARSAYSRPGGYSPLCYAKDITSEMVASYRASH